MDTGYHEQRPRRPDGVIEDEIQLFLDSMDDLDTSDVAVSVRDGHVVLEGRVRTPRDRNLAGHVVASVDGVEAVDNRLEVEGTEAPAPH